LKVKGGKGGEGNSTLRVKRGKGGEENCQS